MSTENSDSVIFKGEIKIRRKFFWHNCIGIISKNKFEYVRQDKNPNLKIEIFLDNFIFQEIFKRHGTYRLVLRSENNVFDNLTLKFSDEKSAKDLKKCFEKAQENSEQTEKSRKTKSNKVVKNIQIKELVDQKTVNTPNKINFSDILFNNQKMTKVYFFTSIIAPVIVHFGFSIFGFLFLILSITVSLVYVFYQEKNLQKISIQSSPPKTSEEDELIESDEECVSATFGKPKEIYFEHLSKQFGIPYDSEVATQLLLGLARCLLDDIIMVGTIFINTTVSFHSFVLSNTTVSFQSFVVVQYDCKFPKLLSSPIRL
jgi:hypothetical protein